MYEPSIAWHKLTRQVRGFASEADLAAPAAVLCCEPRILELLAKAEMPGEHIERLILRLRDAVGKRKIPNIEAGPVEALGEYTPGLVLIRAGGTYAICKAADLEMI
jgi:hypothetical protein